MPNIVVEDGTGLADANSYASVADGDNYHGGNLYSDLWFTAGTETLPGQSSVVERGDIDLAIGMTLPIEITFAGEKANTLYDPYIWFSSTDVVPEVFDWIVVSQSATAMVIALNPAPSTNNSTLHWRVGAPDEDKTEIRDRKETALIMATRSIDYGYNWKGFKSHITQRLQWPRQRVRNRDVYATYAWLSSSLAGIYWPMDALPRAIKDATCQMALDLLRGDRTADADDKGIQSFGLGQGAISVTFNSSDRPAMLSDEVKRILSSLGNSKSGKGSRRIVRVQ